MTKFFRYLEAPIFASYENNKSPAPAKLFRKRLQSINAINAFWATSRLDDLLPLTSCGGALRRFMGSNELCATNFRFKEVFKFNILLHDRECRKFCTQIKDRFGLSRNFIVPVKSLSDVGGGNSWLEMMLFSLIQIENFIFNFCWLAITSQNEHHEQQFSPTQLRVLLSSSLHDSGDH